MGRHIFSCDWGRLPPAPSAHVGCCSVRAPKSCTISSRSRYRVGPRRSQADDNVEVTTTSWDAVCVVPNVNVDNHTHRNLTEVDLEALDYPGQIRVVSWVLNGLGVRVENASITIDNGGVSRQTYWLTDRQGRKLADGAAEALAERLEDFIVTCQPDKRVLTCQEYRRDDIIINNHLHPKCSVVVVGGEPQGNRPGWLLEVASVITGVGLTIHEAVIVGSQEDWGALKTGGLDLTAVMGAYDPSKGRLFAFWVTNSKGEKLDYSGSSSLMYTLGLIFGNTNGPLVPPNMDIARCQVQS